jgi:hypothetical protein
MPQSYVMFPIKPAVHERLLEVRAQVSLMFRFDSHNLGLNPMVEILLAHFIDTPPALEWLKDQVARAPKRGRPRRSTPVVKTDEWGKQVEVPPPVGQPKRRPREHQWISPAAKPEISLCRFCAQSQHAEFVNRCDWQGPLGQTYDPPTRSQLLALHFTDEEIPWAHG